MTARALINVLAFCMTLSVGLGFTKVWDTPRISWLLVLTPFLLAWFYVTYGYVWMLYVWTL